MTLITKRGWWAIGLLAFGLLLAGAVLAAPDALYLAWWTVDGGGGTSAAGQFTLNGTIGQHDAGVLSGGEYRLNGGFQRAAMQEWKLYQPLITRP